VISAHRVVPGVGQLTPPLVRYAEELRGSFTEPIREAAHQPLGACALVYGLLLSSDEAVRAQQLQTIAERASDAARQETERLLPEVQQIAARARLPIVDLALPSLRLMSLDQFEQFRTAIRELIDLDGQVELFEYVLQKVLLRHLEPHFGQPRKGVTQYYALMPLTGDCAVLLSTLAHAGHDDPAQAEKAFRQGAGPLSYAARVEMAFLPADACGLEQFDLALQRLSQAAPQIRKSVLNACALAVATDGWIQEIEAELLRAVADTLDCPVPPFVRNDEANQAATTVGVPVT
jgi:hypothetical protein